MIWGTFHVVDLKLFSESLYYFINKIHTSVAHQDLQAAKPSQNMFKDKVCNGVCSEILHSLCFSPSSHIISHSDDVVRTCLLSWRVDGTDKVNGPFVKYLQGHLWL